MEGFLLEVKIITGPSLRKSGKSQAGPQNNPHLGLLKVPSRDHLLTRPDIKDTLISQGILRMHDL